MNRTSAQTVPPVIGACSLLFAVACIAATPQPVVTATYDVAEFLQTARPDDQPNPPVRPIDPDAPIGNDTQLPSRTEARQQFIKFVCETIDPESWKPGHVPVAAIAIEGDKMTVTQTKDNQRDLANILGQLRGDGSEKLQSTFNQCRLADRKLEKTTLFEAVQSVARETKIPIEVDWRSFGNVVLFADSPVTVDLKRPTAPRAIRGIFFAAAGYTFPIQINATPKAISVAYDDSDAKQNQTRVIDLRTLHARASGLDTAKPFTRAQALAALIDRIKREVPDLTNVKDMDGWIVVNSRGSAQLALVEFLDELDAKAVAQAATPTATNEPAEKIP